MFPDLVKQQQTLQDLCEQHNVARLAIFGSALRDDFAPESDLDFVVTFKPMTPVQHKRAFFGLIEDLESLFHRRIDLIEEGAIRNPFFKATIQKNQETLYASPG